MTLAAALTQSRRYARVDSTGAADSQVQSLIQDAVTQFARDVNGFPTETFLSIAAVFDTLTTFAIHVTIVDSGSEVMNTDIVITSTARTAGTGSTVASDLQTAIRAATGATGTETVTFSSFYFTIDFKQGNTSSGDSIQISTPITVTYTDATDLLGVGGTTTGSTSVTGSFPRNCTVYATLPTDFITKQRILWDEWELQEISLDYVDKFNSSGTPTAYAIKGRDLFFAPAPSTQGRCYVWYKGSPPDIDFDNDTDLPSEIPAQYHQAIPFLTAYFLLLERHDLDKANQFYAQYAQIMRFYKVHYNNTHTTPEGPQKVYARLPKVII